MGDTLWATPAVRAIKKKIPDINIDLLVQPQWIPLFKENKNFRNLIPYYSKWYSQFLLLPTIIKYTYDHVFIFHANNDISRILPFLRTSSIWSHQYPDSIPGVSESKIIHPKKPMHGINRRKAMLEKIHIPSDGTHMDIYLSNDDKEKAKLFLRQNNLKSKNFIYLNIGGSVPHKQLPIKKFIQLSDDILKKTTLSIVLGGGPEDKIRVDDIGTQLGNTKRVIKASHRSIIENCALIYNSRILITPDSGPMHIGYALKVPTIGLFWSVNSQGIQRNELNGPDYCGPLDIGKSLHSELSGTFIDSENIHNEKSLALKPITVEDIWNEIIRFM